MMTSLHDIGKFHTVRPQERLQLVGKHKLKNKHGTCDKKILTPAVIVAQPVWPGLYVPFYINQKRGFFTPLSPVWTNVPFSAIFF